MQKNKVIKVKSYYNNALYEFLCFSTELKNGFIYRKKPMVNEFDIGTTDLFTPVGMTWEEVRQYENNKN